MEQKSEDCAQINNRKDRPAQQSSQIRFIQVYNNLLQIYNHTDIKIGTERETSILAQMKLKSIICKNKCHHSEEKDGPYFSFECTDGELDGGGGGGEGGVMSE